MVPVHQFAPEAQEADWTHARMRPSILNPLFANVAVIKGIGPRISKILAQFLSMSPDEKGRHARIIDLMFHLPVGIIDRRHRYAIRDLPREGIVTIRAIVGRHRPPPRNRRVPYRIECFDETGSLTLVYFHSFADHLERLLPEGESRDISGRIEWYQGEPQMVHPDHVLSPEELTHMPLLEPVYPLTQSLTLKTLGKAIRAALPRLPNLPEWLDAEFLRIRGWPAFGMALRSLHQPEEISDVAPDSPSRQRLAYDELLANQLALLLVRRHMKRAQGRVISGTGGKREKIVSALPFDLTASQQAAISTILKDMAAPDRMMRLLQGDVGAGKTIVALLALVTAVEAGAQGAFMVPTEILARQHFSTLSGLAKSAGIKIDILTSREKGNERQQILKRIAAGESGIVIGTHALFQEKVEFKDLALTVIDEQHRFGVHQRLALQHKAEAATDLLVMTATPIPRTLSLTLYGDMDVSRLTEKPAGRQKIDTRTMPQDRLNELVQGLRRAMASGQKAFWVCPLIEESETMDKAAAEARLDFLSQEFPGRTGIIHGRMKGREKDEIMRKFRTGEIAVLVSTTVIEVGMDVPDASIIVIENAERFGLAQLHQLRGRVGRGAVKSSCILLYSTPLTDTAKARLEIMRQTENGFLIAEEDLRLRGAGEALGTRQSGLPQFRLADLSKHGDLLAAARDDARQMLDADPRLQSNRGEALRLLLYLFERDEAIRLLGAG
jgi:ATP-dependent DNA helicase RecG